MTCGLREWEEETGIDKKYLDIVKNIIPFNEVFVGSNYKSYLHKYFLGIIKNGEIDLSRYQNSEVSDMTWASLDECEAKFRPYNREKYEIVKNINNILDKYSLIS